MSSKVSENFWNSLNQFRGIIEMNSLKNYLLTLVFFKHLTEENKSDRDFLFHIDVHSDFDSILKSTDNYCVGEKLNRYIHKIAISNDLLNGVINFVDFNQIGNLKDEKTQSKILYNLINLINSSVEELISENVSKSTIYVDLFDFIVLMFAKFSGKSFIDSTTPAEVNLIISKILNIQKGTNNLTVYDPTCGIGNTLITVAENTDNHLRLFGQDMNNEMVAIATMNLFIHGLYPFEIVSGDVLNSPKFIEKDNQLKKFDYVVSTPPFNVRSWNNNPEYDIFDRWNSFTGIPSNNNADFAFILHVLASLKENGKAVIVVPHGILFKTGSDANIRKFLIQNGYLTGIIGLPGKLYFGTGIPSCMIVLENNKNISNQDVFIMDASSEFVKDKFTNIITADGVNKIIDAWINKEQVSEFSRIVPAQEIVDNDYNLNIPRYFVNINESKIPENSRIVELSDLLTSLPKIRSNKDFGSTIKISDLSDNPFFYTISIDKLSVGEVNRSFYKITVPALLISKRFNKLKPSFCNSSFDNPVFISQDIEAFSLNNLIDLSYLILELNSESVTKQAESLSIGAVMPSLTTQDIFKLKIVIPDLEATDSIIRQKALAEGSKIQFDKSQIETFQLQKTIDSLLKERMNDFQWTLHDLRNGDLLSIKNKIAVLQKMSFVDNRLNEIIVDINNNVTLSSFIEKLALNVNNLSGVLTSMFDETDNFGIKEKLNLATLLSDFIREQKIIDKDLFYLNDSELRNQIELLEKGQKLFIEFNKNDFFKICTNIFENIKRHSGFLSEDFEFEKNIRLVIDFKKKTQEVTFSFMNTGNQNIISESDYFSNGGRTGKTSNSGKGGFIIKELALRNNATPFQKSFEKKDSNDFAFEVGLTTKYFLNEI